jgi:hypothetical protein
MVQPSTEGGSPVLPRRDAAEEIIAARVAQVPADAPGWEVLASGLKAARELLGEQAVVAAFAIGSLAHGGFVSAVSDVDLAVILDRVRDDTDGLMAEVRRRVKEQFRTPLSGRLSIFWSSWDDLAGHTGRGRFPLVDQYDLVHDALLLMGEDHRSRVKLPSGEALRDGLIEDAASFMLEKLAVPAKDELLLSPQKLVAQGQREVAKAVLFPVRFLFTADVGTLATNKEAVAHYLERRRGPASALVREAGRWREEGLGEPTAVQAALKEGLLPLHRELVETYREHLRRMGRAELAQGLEQWWVRLARASGSPGA